MNAQINGSAFTYLDNFFFDLFLCFLNNFFNSGGVNSTIRNQLMKCQPCYFSAYRVESRKNNCFRCIIYYNFNPCCSFQRTNVSTFASNDTPFDFIVINIKNGYRIFNCRFGSYSLNRLNHNSFCFFIRSHSSFFHNLINLRHGFGFSFCL